MITIIIPIEAFRRAWLCIKTCHQTLEINTCCVASTNSRISLRSHQKVEFRQPDLFACWTRSTFDPRKTRSVEIKWGFRTLLVKSMVGSTVSVFSNQDCKNRDKTFACFNFKWSSSCCLSGASCEWFWGAASREYRQESVLLSIPSSISTFWKAVFDFLLVSAGGIARSTFMSRYHLVERGQLCLVVTSVGDNPALVGKIVMLSSVLRILHTFFSWLRKVGGSCRQLLPQLQGVVPDRLLRCRNYV